jgi:ppGpp synthetase/RelA/SpoT-type nucleotidyltranferase
MSSLPFSYEEFGEWFDAHEMRYLRAAREVAVRVLTEYLDGELREIERVRVKVLPGRVKGKERTWRKLESPKYEGRFKSLDDVPKVIDDLVGLRIVCNNKSDVERVIDLITKLDDYEEGSDPVLVQQGGSLKNNLNKPRDSGYRAIHINLCTSVPSGLTWKVIVCELQVRTLLQDGWGELTHEDTYKPGGTPPALVEILSRRMADLLATVDDIAQDLRQELDELSNVNVEEPSTAEAASKTVAPPHKVPPVNSHYLALREAASASLRRRVEPISKPVDLASLAWEIRKEFGQDVSDGWFGFGTFKSLLKASVPDARVTSEPPSHVLPKNWDASITSAKSHAYPGIPTAALALRSIDHGFPLISKERLNAAYAQLAEASQLIDWNDPTTYDIGRLNDMTRRARELNTGEHPVSRTHLDYIGKSILFSGNLNRPLSAEEVKGLYARSAINRVQEVVHAGGDELEQVTQWLT